MENFRFVDGRFVHEPFTCSCGREHHVPIREIIVKPGALDELVGVMDRLDLGKRGLVIADLNTYDVAGERAIELLRSAGYEITLSLFNTREIVHPDEYAVGKILIDLEPGTSFLLVVGSGCLTDTTRLISSRTGLPFISVGTAASMDGYASLGAPMLVNGMKKTIFVGAPLAIIADVDIMCQAPYDMTTSGFGDLLGKLNSKIDWKLANVVTGEYYCDMIAELVDETVRSCAEQAAAIRTKSPEAIATLAEGLILSGIGMIAVENSRPASGAEHHISHFWEVKAITDNRPEHFHGTKVGVGTALIAKFYEKLATRSPQDIDLDEIKRRKPSYKEWEEQIRQVFGPVADDIITLNKPRLLDWDAQKAIIETIRASWDQIKALQAQEPTYEEVVAFLKTVGGAYLPKDVHVDREFLRETLLHAKDVRAQYTVLSVVEALGWLDEIVEEVVSDFD